MPRRHPLAKETGVTLERMTGYAMVSLPRESQTRRFIDGLASTAGLTLTHAVTVNQFATVMQCVQAGVGIAIVPGGAIPSALSVGLVSRPLKPAVSRIVGVIVLRDRALTPSAEGFLTQLQADWSTPSTSTTRHRTKRS
jgi:DNA-binding transcriptional LysR family regulator